MSLKQQHEMPDAPSVGTREKMVEEFRSECNPPDEPFTEAMVTLIRDGLAVYKDGAFSLTKTGFVAVDKVLEEEFVPIGTLH